MTTAPVYLSKVVHPVTLLFNPHVELWAFMRFSLVCGLFHAVFTSMLLTCAWTGDFSKGGPIGA